MDLFEHAARKTATGAPATAAHVRVERRAEGMAWVRGCTGTLAQVLMREGRVLCPGCHAWLQPPDEDASAAD